MESVSHQPRPGSYRFFTLIELLVVIAIITILASMLLPSLNKARVRAQTTRCAGNVKDFTTALFLYAGDNADFFPPINEVDNSANKRWYTNLLQKGKYVSIPNWSDYSWGKPARESIAMCPAIPVNNGGYGGIGPATTISFLGSSAKYSNLVRRRKSIIAGDTPKDQGPNAWMMPADASDGILYKGPVPTVMRHGGRINVTFIDGHLEQVNEALVRLNSNWWLPTSKADIPYCTD